MSKISSILIFAEAFYKAALNFKGVVNKLNRPIVISKEGAYTKLIILEDAGDTYNVCAGVNLALNMAKMAPGHERKSWPYKIKTIWGSGPMVSTYAFGAALSMAKRLVCDTEVSPAAQLVIKSYWQRYKDNPEYIVQEVLDNDLWNTNAPWLRAGYLATPIGTAYDASFAAGKEIAQQVDVAQLSDIETGLWRHFFRSNVSTKTFSPDALRQTNWLQQQGIANQEEIIQALERGEEIDVEKLLPAHQEPTHSFDLPYQQSPSQDPADLWAQRLEESLNEPENPDLPQAMPYQDFFQQNPAGKKKVLDLKR